MAGLDIFLQEEDLAPLKKGEYYFFQIADCTVVLASGEKIGVVADLIHIQDSDLLVVAKGKREIYVPFVEPICVEINLKERKIIIDPPEGLLELNEI